jgi:hypothetical protein
VVTQPVGTTLSDSTKAISFNEPVVSGVSGAYAMNNAIWDKVGVFITAFLGEAPTTLINDELSTLDGTFTIGLCSPTLLSLRFVVTEYITGGASTFELVSSLNFEVSSGTVISLASLFTNTTDALVVLDTAGAQLIAADSDLGGGILQWPASPALSFFEHCWVFTPTGLQFSWDQGGGTGGPAIAPSAAGVLATTISWTALHNVISSSGLAAEFI